MYNLKYWVIDVDGTMTDGGIYYDENGNEMKKFCTKDAAGFFALHEAGSKIVVLTGRECEATNRRMKELKVDCLYQKVRNKVDFIKNFMEENGISKSEIAYIGDDLNDFAPMQMCGYIGCPADSCREIKAISDYVSPVVGGSGAVRDIIEYKLREEGLWEKCVNIVYDIGV